MNVRRYTARDMRDAMRQVREQQGPEAVILSSRRVDGMLEVVAATEPAPASAPDSAGADQELIAMRRELSDLRTLLVQQQAMSESSQWSSRHPLAAECVARLLDQGFDDKLARGLVGGIGEDESPANAWSRLRARLSASLATAPTTVLDRGGMLALIGPTGVGKTTTIARLALRRIKRMGRDSVTLVTLDSQRLGAARQLQAFGQMAGVPVMLLEHERELANLASRAEDGRLVLIDTAGQTARDAAARTGAFARLREQVELETWLVVAATHQALALKQAIQAFQSSEPSALVLTKVDESARLGETLSALLEQRLGLAYYSDGQRIAEDFHKADTQYLTRIALGEAAPAPSSAPGSLAGWSGLETRLEVRPFAISAAAEGAPPLLERVQPLRMPAHVSLQ